MNSFNLENFLMSFIRSGIDFSFKHKKNYIELSSLKGYAVKIEKNSYREYGEPLEKCDFIFYEETLLWFILSYCDNKDLEFNFIFFKAHTKILVYSKSCDSEAYVHVYKDVISLQLKDGSKIVEINCEPQDLLKKASVYLKWLIP